MGSLGKTTRKGLGRWGRGGAEKGFMVGKQEGERAMTCRLGSWRGGRRERLREMSYQERKRKRERKKGRMAQEKRAINMHNEEEKSFESRGKGGGVRWKDREIDKIYTNQTKLNPSNC